MGGRVRKEHTSLLEKTSKRIIVMLDGDEAGEKGTKEVIKKLKGKQPLKIIRLKRNVQPEETPKEVLRDMMEWDSKNLFSFFYLC